VNPAQVAILDDFQGVALAMADWSRLRDRARITVFRDHVSDPASVIARLDPFDVVCVMRERTPLPRAILEKLPRLKLIASTAQRNAAIDMEAARELGITVCGTASSSTAAGVLTWALILGLLRNLPAETASLRNGDWQVAVGADVTGRTLGVLGLGRIGSFVAHVGRAFGMHLIAWSQNLTADVAERYGVRLVEKDDLFRLADILTIHLVLSDRTKGVVGRRELELMKPTARLVNTSRGPLVDEEALIDALRNRRIAGAALDVFDVEPLPPAHPFRSLDNLLATPHIGFVTEDMLRTFYGETVENIEAWLDGAPIRILNRAESH
jgi:phosphoglycerate dehydrogenase-like enzyme